jgi:hypothetical protein
MYSPVSLFVQSLSATAMAQHERVSSQSLTGTEESKTMQHNVDTGASCNRNHPEKVVRSFGINRREVNVSYYLCWLFGAILLIGIVDQVKPCRACIFLSFALCFMVCITPASCKRTPSLVCLPLI